MVLFYHRGVPHLGLQQNISGFQFQNPSLQLLGLLGSLVNSPMALRDGVSQVTKRLIKALEVFEACLHLFLASCPERGKLLIHQQRKSQHNKSITSFDRTPWLLARWSAKIARYQSHCCMANDTSFSSRSIKPCLINQSKAESAILEPDLNSTNNNTLIALNQILSWSSRSLGTSVYQSRFALFEAMCLI